MISEALELPVEGRQVSHSWFMEVVCHSHGGLGGDMDGGGGWYTCRTKLGRFVACQEILEHLLSAR